MDTLTLPCLKLVRSWSFLLPAHVREAQRAGDAHRDDHAKGPGNFIADDLRRLADAAEERPFASRSVPREHDPEHFARQHREDEEDADGQILRDEVVAEGEGEEPAERGAEGEVRGDLE